ncbi:MAG: hypothetical protein K2O74_04995, partial [Eubacteriales bacterium]|nr:hypothetical protein [Eubacteriales bacterium]
LMLGAAAIFFKQTPITIMNTVRLVAVGMTTNTNIITIMSTVKRAAADITMNTNIITSAKCLKRGK